MGITDDLAKPIRQLQRSIELSVVDPRNQALISYPLSTLSVIIVLASGSFIEKDPAIRNKGSVDIFSGSFNFQTVNP